MSVRDDGPLDPFERWMCAALELARLGHGSTSPNPMVGAVVVRNGERIGSGYHEKAGEPHAERHALAQAGGASDGADLFVTLEPCCFQGRTGPCTEAIIDAKIARVFIGSMDPNPRVAGAGIQRLIEAGIEVRSGLLEEQCRTMNQVFNHWVTTGRPWVTLKLATSLDGRIATRTGASQWISGPDARNRVHQRRAVVDAVMVGSGTALADDPRLTARDVELPSGQPARIVVDSNLKVPTSALIFSHEEKARMILASACKRDSAQPAPEIDAREQLGAHVLSLPDGNGQVDLDGLIQALGAMEPNPITSVLVEGGRTLATSLLSQNLVQELWFFVAPTLIGGDGMSVIDSIGINSLDEARHFEIQTLQLIGGDVEIVAIPKRIVES